MATREQLIVRAGARREQGAPLREIAGELGVSPTTILRWTNSEQAERARERSRLAKLARRAPCERCARPLGYERTGGLCKSCIVANARALIDRVATLYAAGHDTAGIARLLAVGEPHVRVLLARLRRAGKVELRYPPRDATSVRRRERRIAILRRRGYKRREIARRVGLTEGSVGTVLSRLGARGASTT